jgi:2-phosphosulfolactate phosphatase
MATHWRSSGKGANGSPPVGHDEPMSFEADHRHVATEDIGEVTGPVVAIDVIRAFTTSAYAFGAGARHIYLVAGVDEALAFKAAHPGAIAMGEDHGLRPEGFDLPNSPVLASRADLDGRVIVQRTSAGTRGVVAAGAATRLWCAGLVCAAATAAAVDAAGLGAPTYVITGWFTDGPGRPGRPGDDDRLTAGYIESVRLGERPDPDEVGRLVASSDEARRTLALGSGHVDPEDIAYATNVDRFDFAMEVTRDPLGLRLDRQQAPCPRRLGILGHTAARDS